MYGPLLLVHSWIRWVLVLAALYFWLRCLIGWKKAYSWTEKDQGFLFVLHQVFLYQLAFGLTLWFGTSPLIRAAIHEPSLILKSPLLFYWTCLHPLGMLSGFVVFEVGRRKALKSEARMRFRLLALGLSASLLVVLLTIPWPWFEYGRPLLRSGY